MGIKFSGSDAGGFRFDFSGANSAAGGSEGSAAPKRERKPRKAVGTPGKRIAINSLVTLLVGAVIRGRSPMKISCSLISSVSLLWSLTLTFNGAA